MYLLCLQCPLKQFQSTDMNNCRDQNQILLEMIHSHLRQKIQNLQLYHCINPEGLLLKGWMQRVLHTSKASWCRIHKN